MNARQCAFPRVGTADLAFPVLLNQQPVLLPAVLATCSAEKEDPIHIYYLDQPANPLTLALQIGGSRPQSIRITVPPQKAQQANAGASANARGSGNGRSAQMEQKLAEKKPSEIYGIYFDFDSPTLNPKSERMLNQIAGILHRNPNWKLSVSGHTDNVGDGSFNMELSQRRAATVKNALVTRYRIVGNRLTTVGFGATLSIASNDTMEGRAHNRRVELVRD